MITQHAYLIFKPPVRRLRYWVSMIIFSFSTSCTPLLDEVLWDRNSETTELFRMVESGDATAQTALGQRYETGNGVEQNYKHAKAWYERAVEQGDPLAMFLLGNMFEKGTLGTPDYQSAATLYLRAASSGDASAQASLAQLYEKGLGVQQSYAMANTWYTRAAEQWEVNNDYPLGIPSPGLKGSKDVSSEAIRWFRRAANLGVAEAQFDLARAYEAGSGVSRNLRIALIWYEAAASQGHSRSAAALIRLRNETDPISDPQTTVTTKPNPIILSQTSRITSTVHQRTTEPPSPQNQQNFLVHLASYRNVRDAEKGWARLLADHESTLNKLLVRFSEITIPEEGLFYRVEVGPFATLSEAQDLCETLAKRSAYCRTLKNPQ